MKTSPFRKRFAIRYRVSLHQGLEIRLRLGVWQQAQHAGRQLASGLPYQQGKSCQHLADVEVTVPVAQDGDIGIVPARPIFEHFGAVKRHMPVRDNWIADGV